MGSFTSIMRQMTETSQRKIKTAHNEALRATNHLKISLNSSSKPPMPSFWKSKSGLMMFVRPFRLLCFPAQNNRKTEFFPTRCKVTAGRRFVARNNEQLLGTKKASVPLYIISQSGA